MTGSSNLAEIAPNIFVHDGAKRFLGFRLQRCMTIVRLPGDRLLVHSPNGLDPPLREELDHLGRVELIVAPNKMHNFALDQFASTYPSARFYAAPGLPERRPDLKFDGVLGNEPEPEWAGELDQAMTDGNAFFSEVLFLHRRTGTLIVTDLVENIHREHVSSWGLVVTRLVGISGKPVPSPEHSMYTTDADTFAASVQKVLDWEFDRIILSHGTRIETGGKRIFESVVDTVISRVRRRGRLTTALYRAMARVQ